MSVTITVTATQYFIDHTGISGGCSLTMKLWFIDMWGMILFNNYPSDFL